MTRPRVLVLGSKPGATVTSADYTYCANCASRYCQDTLAANRPLVNVVAGGLIAHPHAHQKPEIADRHREQYRMILDARPETLVIVHVKPDPTPYLQAESRVREDGYDGEIRHVRYHEQRLLVHQHTGLSNPIKPYDLSSLAMRYRLNYVRDRARAAAQGMLRNEARCKNPFRPSTGLFTLVYALSMHGADAEYVLSGIGLRDRNRYQDGTGLKRGHMTPHVHADDRALRVLAERYSITTTEAELTGLLPAHERSG